MNEADDTIGNTHDEPHTVELQTAESLIIRISFRKKIR